MCRHVTDAKHSRPAADVHALGRDRRLLAGELPIMSRAAVVVPLCAARVQAVRTVMLRECSNVPFPKQPLETKILISRALLQQGSVSLMTKFTAVVPLIRPFSRFGGGFCVSIFGGQSS